MTRAASACSAPGCRSIRQAKRWAWPQAECIQRGETPAREARTTDGASPGVIPLGERSRCDDLAAAKITPWYAPAKAGDDLVIDGVAGRREVLSRLRCTGLRADQNDLVALARVGDVGHVKHHEVHADAACEAHAAAAEQHRAALSGNARKPVAVPDGDGRDPAVAGKPVLVPVGHAGAGRNARDPKDARSPAQRGPKRHRVREMRRRMEAVHREPRTYRVHAVDRSERRDTS